MRSTLATCSRWLALAAFALAVALPAQAQRNVTLRLNTATLPDTIKTDIDRNIQVRGCLEGCEGDQSSLPGGDIIAWNDNTTLAPASEGGDYWETTFQIPDGEQLFFKFYAQQSEDAGIGGWEDGDNQALAAGTGDTTLVLHYFEKGDNQGDYGWRPFETEEDSVGVWFRVYMNTQSAVNKGGSGQGYDPADEDLVVAVRGNFGTLNASGAGGAIEDWSGEDARLTREDGNEDNPGYHLYSGLVKFPASAVDEGVSYKFYFADSNTTGDTGYEDDINGGNRSFTVPAGDTTLYWQFYSNSPAFTGPDENEVEATVDFLVDIQPLIDVDIFDLSRGDEIQVRGGFNGWDCPDDNQDDCGLFRVPASLTYGNSVPITAVPGDGLDYKYYAIFNVDEDNDGEIDGDWANIGWEEPLDNGGADRVFEFDGVAQTLPTEFFNAIRAGNVIPAGDPIPVTFQVNMDAALAFETDAFDPATDDVVIQFEDPVWRVTQGYDAGDPTDGLVTDFVLTDTDGDGVYTGAFSVQRPTYNGIGYRFAYGNETDGYIVEGAGGFDSGRRRYRYVLSEGGAFPASYTFPLDVFRPTEAEDPNAVMPVEANPTDPDRAALIANNPIFFDNGFTDPFMPNAIEDRGGPLPTAAVLDAAYPNPFARTTQIEYSVPVGGEVSLVVYDVTGRVVATLVDEVQAASNYRVEFDAADLASGVYVYQLRTADAVVSKRMTLIR